MQANALYNDFGQIAALRADANHSPEQTLDAVASQFEALFVQMMVKSMRDATINGGLFQSNQLDTYQQMADQQLSFDIANKGGVGLATVIKQQLAGTAGGVSSLTQNSDFSLNRGKSLVKEFLPVVATTGGKLDSRI